MTKHPRPNLDPIEQAMDKVLAAGTYIPDESASSFVIELEGIESMIAALVRDDPSRAVALYETYLAVCDMKAEEIDDSSGMFGQFVGELSALPTLAAVAATSYARFMLPTRMSQHTCHWLSKPA